MERELRVVLSKDKKTEHAFIVALIPVPQIPPELKCSSIVTDCAVVAANDIDGNGIYSYATLDPEEKQIIGDVLVSACVPINTWMWCELFDDGV